MHAGFDARDAWKRLVSAGRQAHERLILGAPRLVVAAAAASAIVSLAVAVPRLRFDTDWQDLAPPSPQAEEYRRIVESFEPGSVVLLALEGDDPEALARGLESAAARLSPLPGVDHVEYGVDREWLERYGVYLLDDADFELLQPALAGGGSLALLDSMSRGVRRMMTPSAGPQPRPDLLNEHLGRINHFLASLSSPTGSLLPADTYQFSRDRRMALMSIVLKSTVSEARPLLAAVAAIKKAVDGLALPPGARVLLTGIPVIAYEENAAMQQGMVLSTVGAFTLILLIQILAFGSIRETLLIMLWLLTGISWSFLLIALTGTQLNSVTSMFVPILLGLGIDSGIHYCVAFGEARAMTGDSRQGVVVALRKTALPILLCALTTSLAFLMLTVSGFPLFREVGWIAGVGILLCTVAMLVPLPASLILWHAGKEAGQRGPLQGALARGFAAFVNKAWLAVCIACALLAGLSAWIAAGIRFDADMRNMQPLGLQSMSAQERILEAYGFASTQFYVRAADLDAARELTRLYRANAAVARVDSPSDLVAEPSVFAARRRSLSQYSEAVPAAPESRLRTFRAAVLVLGRSQGVLRSMGADERSVSELARAVERIRSLSAAGWKDRLAAIDEQLALARDRAAAAEPPGLETLPAAQRRQLVGKDGRECLLVIYPADPLWDADELTLFLERIRGVPATPVGLPSLFLSIGQAVRHTSVWITLAALALILATLVVGFQSMRDAVIAVLNLCLCLVATLAVARLLRVALNFASVFALPVLAGTVVDNGIHIISRFRKEGDLVSIVAGAGKGVALASLTTIVGFAGLAFNLYRGIRSFGLMLVIGFSVSFVLTLCFLVALLAAGRAGAQRPGRSG